jgi:HK97 family phage portal protein
MAFKISRALEAQGKALGPHPSFMDLRTPVSVYSPGSTREDATISQRSALHHMQAYGGTEAIDWVYDCVGLYSDPAGMASYHLEQADGTKLVRVKNSGTPPEYKVGPTDFYRLLDKPNDHMLYNELMALLVIDLMLVGNGYWFKWRSGASGKPLAIYRLAPGYVKIIPGPYGPKGYKYQPPGVKDPLEISVDQIIHFRRPNPHDPYYGMGVIQGAGRAMDLEIAITDTQASYFENKGDPSLIVQSERRLPSDVRKKLTAQLRARVAGPSRSGELLVLEAGLKASTLDRKAAEQMFRELGTMSRDRIYAKFRASPRLFGITDESGSADKVSDYRREFDNSALKPFLGRLSTQISAALAELWGVQYFIDHESNLPAADAILVLNSVAVLPGIKVREIRRLAGQFGIEESTGDSKIDETVLNMPGPEMDANGQIVDPITGKKVSGQAAGAADRPIGSEAGRPPKGKNTSAIGVAKVKAQGKALDELMAQLAAKALASDGARTSIGRLSAEQAPLDRNAIHRKADIDASVAFIQNGLAEAAHELERALLDHVEGKALKTSDLAARVRNSSAWTAFRQRVERVLQEGARRSAASGVMQSGLTPDGEIDYDSIASSVVHRPEGLRSIVKTFRDRVVARVKEARSADGERHDLQAAVKEAVDTWVSSQATTVAETEAVHAYNEATLTAAEMSGMTQVYVTDGDDGDEPCIQANGSVWEIEHARENRLEHPHCRRAFLPLELPA